MKGHRSALKSVRLALILAFCINGWFNAVGDAQAQLPIPATDQIRQFYSLPQATQQAIIRELQSQLSPAQRASVLAALESGRAENLDAASQEALSQALLLRDAESLQGLEDEEEVTFAPNDTLVVQLSWRDETPAAAATRRAQDTELLERLSRSNPYELDSLGQLLLPGVAPMRLGGLNVEEATVRVEAEPLLRPFSVVLTRLPLAPVGTEALKPFGYSLFEEPPSRLPTTNNLPVPIGYLVGPGDSVTVQLFGNQNAEYFLQVNRDGTINFPEIGPLSVSGLTFDQVRTLINERVSEQLIGVRASVTMGELRSIGVLVLGDVSKPGEYTVSGFATVLTALRAAGGVTEIGSLRNIELRRLAGGAVERVDLYDLQLSGDTRSDLRLQPGDSVFVPPIGATLAIDGEVRRPALYELRNEQSVAEVIGLAGGLTPWANQQNLKLERVVRNRGITVEEIDLTSGGGTLVRDGDVIRVLRVLSDLQNSVRLSGNVFEPGLYPLRPGMRLGDLLPSPTLLRPRSDLGYVVIRRETIPNVRTEILSADLEQIWRDGNNAKNPVLQSRDTVYVFDIEAGRRHIVDPLLEDLIRQNPPNAPAPVVRIGGQVRSEGEYPFEGAMRVSDLLRAGGGMSASAYTADAELTRYAVVDGEYRETELVRVNLAAILRGDVSADTPLRPYDYLNVREIPRWRGQESVTLHGEVVFPGTYPISRGEPLSEVIKRAGGLTDLACAECSLFTRVERMQREREELAALASRLERELAAMSLSDANSSEAIANGQALIENLRSITATGRVVIQLQELVQGNAAADVVLKDGDRLYVPSQAQEVAVIGEVQYATSHLFDPRLERSDYVAKSGGFTRRADSKRVYVVRANGEVMADAGRRWFRRSGDVTMRPGDTIVVPLDVEQRLGRWTAITQIIYNLAIAAAAVNSFD